VINEQVVKEKKHRINPLTRIHAIELRRGQTPIEERLWRELRSRRLAGLKFRRQHTIGNFIVDFYCADKKLVVEIDGDSHADQIKYDEKRTKWLEYQGYRIIRFTNREVLNQLPAVLEKIMQVFSND